MQMAAGTNTAHGNLPHFEGSRRAGGPPRCLPAEEAWGVCSNCQCSGKLTQQPRNANLVLLPKLSINTMTEPMGLLAVLDLLVTDNRESGRLIPVTIKLWLSLAPSRIHRKLSAFGGPDTFHTGKHKISTTPTHSYDKASLIATTLSFS